jgi:hypothetical protein
LSLHQPGLLVDSFDGQESRNNTPESDKKQGYVWGVFGSKESAEIAFRFTLGPVAFYGGCVLFYFALDRKRRRKYWLGVSLVLITAGLAALTMPRYWQDAEEQNKYPIIQHDAENVSQKLVDVDHALVGGLEAWPNNIQMRADGFRMAESFLIGGGL